MEYIAKHHEVTQDTHKLGGGEVAQETHQFELRVTQERGETQGADGNPGDPPQS